LDPKLLDFLGGQVLEDLRGRLLPQGKQDDGRLLGPVSFAMGYASSLSIDRMISAARSVSRWAKNEAFFLMESLLLD